MAISNTEDERLHALKQLRLLDTPPAESFDRITRMASQLFDLPIAAISLTDSDRQWFKSRVGVDHWEIPRDRAPCGEVADTTRAVLIPDLRDHPCYRDSLLAQSGIRFYAGAPLITREGFCLGAMCVLGTEPRQVSEQEQAALTDLAAMVMAQVELQHAFGRVDAVTGLPNRHQLLEDLHDQAAGGDGGPRHLVLAEVIDALKMSDTVRVLGVGVIEDLMREATRAISASIGLDTQIYHVGAAQFAWIVRSSQAETGLEDRLRDLGAHLHKHLSSAPVRISLNPVIGVAPIAVGQTLAEDAIRMAHNAAQEARLTGQSVSTYSMVADDHHRRRFRLLSDMRTALISGRELSLVYQPRIDLRTGACIGAEALLRWKHPELGGISPGEFIPLVEQTDLAGPLTAWVIAEAIRQIMAWRDMAIELSVSVNVSVANLDQPEFATDLIEHLQRAGIRPSVFEVEVTESALIKNRTHVEEQLRTIRNAGIRVAIDDFGTGYSSLSYLRHLPADLVKIDQSFVRDLAGDQKGQMLVRHLIEMSRGLGFRVVAEGVEDAQAYEILRSWHCEEAQGYWMSPPLAAIDLQAWLGAQATVRDEAA
ncbi:GGDEF and EAL domain-containing protein [Methylobacterium sp. V23]|uniref:putative bifunctional diguanylate cyclase/phosphodiesterase n=1 Tax=Methylobacterium sp. V23 TaxID=2044878 RepID=UPI000CDA3167|nr:GGDEF and EAL domain-containing protein [Methylobacterium sp. V23]POR42480.1 sensor domain-containing phosphodiesterase [Methylobacterium sp. V23]